MNDRVEMVYTHCVNWLNDWLEIERPVLMDEWDLSMWMLHEMNSAHSCFIEYGFNSQRAKNDAILILRALYFEYFLMQQSLHTYSLSPNPSAVERLTKIQQTAQKSSAWHSESYNLLTSHEFGAVCYGTPARKAAVVAKKCVQNVMVDESQATSSNIVFLSSEDGSLSALKWGWRFEPIVRDLFERCVAEGPVYDGLGRIRHSSISRLAASPDGIITAGPRCGRLVEIKSPITRELTGEIPLDYYCQMQLQAEVCDTEAVEYVECRCEVFNPLTVNMAKLTNSKIPWIGKVCVVAKDNFTPSTQYEYVYSPLFPNTTQGVADCLAWKTDPSLCLHESSYWYVHDWFTKTVLRNRRWWDEVAYPAYEQFWKDVEEGRATGRFKPQSMFLDSSTEGSHISGDEAGEEGTDRKENDTVIVLDGHTNDEVPSDDESAFGIWQGGESD